MGQPVVDMLDTIGAGAGNIPAGTKRVAIYLTGGGGIAWTNADVAKLNHDDPELQSVLRIDQSNSLLHLPVYLIKDVEAGASTNTTAIDEVQSRRLAGLRSGIYTSRANYPAMRQMVESVPGLLDFVDFWVADWNLSREEAINFMFSDDHIKAVQWASPTSNPQTLVPNSSRNLLESNIDLSVTRADWPAPLPAPRPKPKPKRRPPKVHPKVTAAGISGVLTTALLAYLNSHGAHVTHLDPAETSLIAVVAGVIAGYFTPSKAAA